MLDLEFDLLMMEAADRLVLQSYLAAEQEMVIEPPAEMESADEPIVRTRWAPRIREIEGVPADRLAPCHGRLIALGYLQFQLQGRDAGVVYHVTPQGRAVLSSAGHETLSEEPVRRSA